MNELSLTINSFAFLWCSSFVLFSLICAQHEAFRESKQIKHVDVTLPQETTITEIKQKIMKIPDASGLVIDGFPRDVGQALSFEDQVSFHYYLQ